MQRRRQVHAAQRAEADKAVLIHKGGHQTQRVHMGGNHHTAARTGLVRNDVAQRVAADLGIRGAERLDGIGNGRLPPGGAIWQHQLPDQIKHCYTSISASSSRSSAAICSKSRVQPTQEGEWI